MDFEKPGWCAKCFLRIAPYDTRTVYQGVGYHQNCFMKLVHEQADEERARAMARKGKVEANQYVRSR